MTVEVMAHYTHPSQVEREDFSVFGAPGQVSVQPPSASLIQEPPRVALTAAPPPHSGIPGTTQLFPLLKYLNLLVCPSLLLCQNL